MQMKKERKRKKVMKKQWQETLTDEKLVKAITCR